MVVAAPAEVLLLSLLLLPLGSRVQLAGAWSSAMLVNGGACVRPVTVAISEVAATGASPGEEGFG